MRVNNLSIILIPALSMLLSSEASAVTLLPNNPNFQEINALAGKGPGESYSMIASYLMGAWGYDVNAGPLANQDQTQENLYDACQDFASSWPGYCNPHKLAKLVSTMFAPQNWLVPSFSASKQDLALTNQIMVLRFYKSPIAIPLYGHVDHWGTISRMEVDANFSVVSEVWYYDGGEPKTLDPNVVATDLEGTPYQDALRHVTTGALYKATYWRITSTAILEPTEPLYNKYLFAYDPPRGRDLWREADARPVTWAAGTPMVEPGQMSEALASTLVWDALEDQGLLNRREFASLTDATPGEAFAVEAKLPSGAAWDYIVVPMYDEEMRGVVALVGLSGEDGSFEQMRYFGRPRAIDLPTRGEAAARASRLLRSGEELGAGTVKWDPDCGEEHCRQPLLPYRDFAVRSARGEVGRISVPMGDAAVSRR